MKKRPPGPAYRQAGKNQKYIWIGIGLAIAAGLFIYFQATPKTVEGRLDGFAQCLAQKNITMYGAVWCPWCQKEKANFGDSFRFVPYVECPENAQKCLDLDVKGYPTWIFPDGHRLQGYQGVETLSKESGCELPQ